MYEKQSRNSNRSSDTIASFLLKTYQILEHPEYERMISWDKSNVGFIIHDVVSFTRQILPKYFRHSNFSSFVRQLNMYDFHKVKQQNQSLVFKNPLFCKGQQQNLKFIRRKAAKKVGGQRRQQINDRVDAENQKYENLLKGFKKSFETEINHSSFFYERSIQLMKDLNDSNIKKQQCIRKLYESDQQHETNEETKEMIEKRKASQNGEAEQKQRKDTIIQIPRQFLNQEQDKEKENKNPEASMRQGTNALNIDRVMELKEQLYKSLGIYESWLQDYIEINKKKVKYLSSSRQQLIKCRQNKVQENQDNNYGINSAEHDKHESNEQAHQHHNENNEDQKPISLEELNQRVQNNQHQDNQTEVISPGTPISDIIRLKPEANTPVVIRPEVKSVLPIIRVFEQPKSNQNPTDKLNGSAPFQQSGFIPINETFSSRLFSTFSKPKEEKPLLQQQSEQSACEDLGSERSYDQDMNENQSQV